MFVHLHCHSHYSFLRGVNPPQEIIAAAVEQKMPAVALTDTNGMYAAVPFYRAAHAAGVKPIVGVVVEMEVKEVNEVKKKEGAAAVRQASLSSSFTSSTSVTFSTSLISPLVAMVLLAADAEGYSNLCRLTTLRHLGVLRPGQETFAEDAARPVTVEELTAHSAGVIALWPANTFLRMDLACRSRCNTFRRATGGRCGRRSGWGERWGFHWWPRITCTSSSRKSTCIIAW